MKGKCAMTSYPQGEICEDKGSIIVPKAGYVIFVHGGRCMLARYRTRTSVYLWDVSQKRSKLKAKNSRGKMPQS